MRSGADFARSEVASVDKDAEGAMRRGRASEAGFSAVPDDPGVCQVDEKRRLAFSSHLLDKAGLLMEASQARRGRDYYHEGQHALYGSA
jgi:hypothetical protein